MIDTDEERTNRINLEGQNLASHWLTSAATVGTLEQKNNQLAIIQVAALQVVATSIANEMYEEDKTLDEALEFEFKNIRMGAQAIFEGISKGQCDTIELGEEGGGSEKVP